MISRLVARKIFSLQGCLEEVNGRPRHARAKNSSGKSVHQARSKRLIQWEWLTVNIVLERAGGASCLASFAGAAAPSDFVFLSLIFLFSSAIELFHAS